MKCPKCGTIMESENYDTHYIDNDHIVTDEEFWCSYCDYTCKVSSTFKKIEEEIR